MSNIKLSPNFYLNEFTISQTGARNNIPNIPTSAVIGNLKNLCTNVLEPIRAHFRLPIVISSGYRSPAINKLVGGRPSSQHLLGEAADFIIPGVPLKEVYDWVIKSNLPYDQIIQEFNIWIHISHTSRRTNRRMYFIER